MSTAIVGESKLGATGLATPFTHVLGAVLPLRCLEAPTLALALPELELSSVVAEHVPERMKYLMVYIK